MTRVRADPRGLAHEVLVRVERTGAFADVLLARRLAEAGLATADRRLATELVYGTLTWQGRLDHYLQALLRGPVADLAPPVRAALRLGLYQLLGLDRVPAYAAVDGSVRLVTGKPMKGLVNAVLRRATRLGRDGVPLPDPTVDLHERLAVEWSHPPWLVARWSRELGAESLAALLEADNRPAGLALRVNLQRTTRAALRAELAAAGVTTRDGAWAGTAVVVEAGGEHLHATREFREGYFAFQGETSQLVVERIPLEPGARVLDACAAPGGKSTALAERLGPAGRLGAVDPQRAGLRRLVAETQRLGLQSVTPVAGDARRPPVGGSFDLVVADAPCSGLGTLRRHPELKWRRTESDLPRLAAVQSEILAGLAPLVRPGGLLVYAVCTRTKEETLDVVERFRAAQPRFDVEPFAGPATTDGFLMTAPHPHGLDGFFVAMLRAETAR